MAHAGGTDRAHSVGYQVGEKEGNAGVAAADQRGFINDVRIEGAPGSAVAAAVIAVVDLRQHGQITPCDCQTAEILIRNLNFRKRAAGGSWVDPSGKKLDYLIIDLPPGTGDVSISLNQLTTLNGQVIVCTPQKTALIDAVRAVDMVKKIEKPMLGLIENMSYFLCDGCGKKHDIFGTGGVKQYAQANGLPFLGEVPFSPEIRKYEDSGSLFDIENNSAIMSIFDQIAANLVEQVKANPVMPKLNMM